MKRVKKKDWDDLERAIERIEKVMRRIQERDPAVILFLGANGEFFLTDVEDSISEGTLPHPLKNKDGEEMSHTFHARFDVGGW